MASCRLMVSAPSLSVVVPSGAARGRHPLGQVLSEPLAEKQSRAVDPRLHVGDADPENLADLQIRQTLDIAQDHGGAGVDGQIRSEERRVGEECRYRGS